MPSSLIASALSKTYGSGPVAVHALKPTDLLVAPGECLVIIGPSGSGKSTLLHLLAGLDRPSNGLVHVNGTNLYDLTDDELAVFRRRNIGFVFQFFNLIPILSAEENIKLPLLLDGREADPAHVAELMDTLGLTERRHHLPDALSGGQQQRVAIGRALVAHPAVVFADEPTGNLDTEAADQVLALLMSAARRYGRIVVIATHDLRVASHASRVIALRDGQIVSDRRGRG